MWNHEVLGSSMLRILERPATTTSSTFATELNRRINCRRGSSKRVLSCTACGVPSTTLPPTLAPIRCQRRFRHGGPYRCITDANLQLDRGDGENRTGQDASGCPFDDSPTQFQALRDFNRLQAPPISLITPTTRTLDCRPDDTSAACATMARSRFREPAVASRTQPLQTHQKPQ